MSSEIDVRDFGAVGDGRADDTPAIQRALDRAGEVGGTVGLPAGVYSCSSLTMRPHTGLHAHPTWSFRSFGGAILRACDAQARCLLDLTGAIGATVHGLNLDGALLGEGMHGIRVDKPDYGTEEDTPRLERCRISRFTGDGVHLSRIWCFSVRSCMISHNRGDGLRVRGWDGFVLDNWLSGNGGAGFAAREENASNTLTGNRIEWNCGGGIVLQGGSHYNITGNYLDRSGGPALRLGLGHLKQGPSSCIAMTGNVLYRSAAQGQLLEPNERSHIWIEAADGLVLTGNTFRVGRDDGGKGQLSPDFGIVYGRLEHSILRDNVLHRGAVAQLLVDLGEHGENVLVEHNVGSLAADA